MTDSTAIVQWMLFRKVKEMGFDILLGGMGGQGGIFGTHGIGSFKNIIENLKKSDTIQKIETTARNIEMPELISNAGDYLGANAGNLWDKINYKLKILLNRYKILYISHKLETDDFYKKMIFQVFYDIKV